MTEDEKTLARAPKARLMPLARYEPTLSEREVAVLAALTDDQKLTVSHAIRLAIIDVRNGDHEILKALVDAWETDDFDKLPEAFARALVAILKFDAFKERKASDAVREPSRTGCPSTRVEGSSSSSVSS